MAKSNPTQHFSIFEITPYALNTLTIGDDTFKKGQPFGTFEIVGDASVNQNASSVQNRGGSSYYARANEITEIDSEVVINIREMPKMLYSLYAGATVTETAASATGTVDTIRNAYGTSMVAATGMASVGVKSGSDADLRFDYYACVATGAAAFDVYAMTSMQFEKLGTSGNMTWQNDENKITASPLTLVQSAAVEIPYSGCEITGGAGVIALVTGDVAVFKSTPAHGGINTIDIGKNGVIFPEHGMVLYGRERNDSTKIELEVFRASVSSGITLPMPLGDFMTTDVTFKALLSNSPLDGSGVAKTYQIRTMIPA